MVNKWFILILFLGIIFTVEQENTYFDLEGNEIVFKDQRWRYVQPPPVDCNIPYDVFIRYIRENADVKFQSDDEAFRFGSYKMPHMNVCPPLDYSPIVYPINADYEIKANWDSLKVGMTQKSVRNWFHFNPMLSYEKNEREIWKYYGFGTMEFDSKGQLIQWKYKGSDNQTIYHKEGSSDLRNLEKEETEISWYMGMLIKIKKILPW